MHVNSLSPEEFCMRADLVLIMVMHLYLQTIACASVSAFITLARVVCDMPSWHVRLDLFTFFPGLQCAGGGAVFFHMTCSEPFLLTSMYN